MKISLACDHGALTLKQKVRQHLEAQGHTVVDFGTNTPDYAFAPSNYSLKESIAYELREQLVKAEKSDALKLLERIRALETRRPMDPPAIGKERLEAWSIAYAEKEQTAEALAAAEQEKDRLSEQAALLAESAGQFGFHALSGREIEKLQKTDPDKARSELRKLFAESKMRMPSGSAELIYEYQKDGNKNTLNRGNMNNMQGNFQRQMRGGR